MRTEWALRYERTDAPRMDNPSGEVTVEMVMPEQNARWSVERGLPLSGRNHRVVRRQVTEWEEA